MNKPIFDPAFWKQRIEEAKIEHHIVFKCTMQRWKEIEEGHRTIIWNHINQSDSILDLGCGYGRLLGLMPSGWVRDYAGFDVSPDLIEMAEDSYPDEVFFEGDFLDIADIIGEIFDWGIMISIKGMIIREMGQEAWDVREKEMLKVCQRSILVEYTPDEYEIIEGANYEKD